MDIRAITFDFWNTLFRNVNSVQRDVFRRERIVEATGATPEAVEQAYRAMIVEFSRSHIKDQRTLTPEDGVRLVCEHLGVALSRETAAALTHDFATAILQFPPEPVEGALDAVREARNFFRVGLISDTGLSPGRSLRILLEEFGFIPYFDVLTFSDEVGVAKPQRPMYETTAAKLCVHPDQLLHIGDLEPTDIVGAKSVGAKAALFVGVHDKYREGTTADWVVESWSEFVALLPRLV